MSDPRPEPWEGYDFSKQMSDAAFIVMRETFLDIGLVGPELIIANALVDMFQVASSATEEIAMNTDYTACDPIAILAIEDVIQTITSMIQLIGEALPRDIQRREQ